MSYSRITPFDESIKKKSVTKEIGGALGFNGVDSNERAEYADKLYKRLTQHVDIQNNSNCWCKDHSKDSKYRPRLATCQERLSSHSEAACSYDTNSMHERSVQEREIRHTLCDTWL